MSSTRRVPPPAIPVLLYHSIPSRDDRDPLSVPDERFIAHMWQVRESGRVALTISQLAAGLRGAIDLPARAVAITFDDGHANNVQAIEHLVDAGLRATVYLTTGSCEQHATLNPCELDSIADDPERVEIGAHSVTHPRLDELAPPSVGNEVRASKAHLEQVLGREVSSFAYPFGCYDRWVRHAVASAGYRSAVAVKNALSHLEDDPMAIARVTVGKDTSASELARILEGEGIRRAWSHERLRTRAYRSARRVRRHLGRGAPAMPTAAPPPGLRSGLPDSAVGACVQETSR